MFFHNFKYNLLSSLRDKSQILWSLVFIMALGTLFKITFGDIYDQDERLKDIKVAVCIEDETIKTGFDMYVAGVSINENGDELLDITYVSNMQEAEALLENEEVAGIFYDEEGELKLMIAKDDIKQSILASVVGRYHQIMTIISEIAGQGDNSTAATAMMVAMAENYGENTEIKNSNSDMDVYVQYFYNLIAMACIMSVSVGLTITTRNQCNTSYVGARKEVSGVNHITSSISGLLAGALVQTACVLLSLGYLVLLGVNFGHRYGMIMLIIAVGIFSGSSIGFCIGSIGGLDAKVKEGISTAFSVVGSFLSGLMIADMRIIVEDTCPIINRINPVALVYDSFYAINTFDTNDRLYRNLLSLLVISVIAIVLGNIFGRRRRYASL